MNVWLPIAIIGGALCGGITAYIITKRKQRR